MLAILERRMKVTTVINFRRIISECPSPSNISVSDDPGYSAVWYNDISNYAPVFRLNRTVPFT